MKLLSNLFLIFIVGCSSVPLADKGWTYSEKHLDFSRWKREPSCCTATGKKFAIAAGGTHSSQAGNEMYRLGGNAVDAAVAISFALAVERPHSMGIGGGGFMILHLPGKKATFVDFRETAPAKASKDMYLDKDGNLIKGLSTDGALSIATPGFVIGLGEVHKKWGKLSWKKVLEPAIRLADQGFLIYPDLEDEIKDDAERIKSDAYLTSILFNKEGQPLKTGERLVQKDLGKTLRRISKNGPNEFRTGESAKKIVSYVKSKKGILSLIDFKNYKVKYRQPLTGRWKGYEFVSAPPPSAGGIVIAQTLGVLDGLGFSADKQVDSVQYFIESLKQGYADRATYLGDPDFVKVPVASLTSKEYVGEIRERIKSKGTVPSSEIKPRENTSPHTSHFSVMDESGASIGCTMTINTSFGSGLAAPGTGVILNNEMDDFSAKPGERNAYGLTGAEANSIAPGKRPVSSMSPTIVYKEGKPIMVVGAAGGSRIITTVAQVMLGTLEYYSGDVKKSLFAPRVHHQWLPDRIEFEEGYDEEVMEALQKRGYAIGKWPYKAVAAGVYRSDEGSFTAVFDPRSEGGAEAH